MEKWHSAAASVPEMTPEGVRMGPKHGEQRADDSTKQLHMDRRKQLNH
jgi:hypothetical protein